MAVCEPDLQTPVMGVTEAWLRLDLPLGTRRPAEWLGDPSNITQITASSVTRPTTTWISIWRSKLTPS